MQKLHRLSARGELSEDQMKSIIDKLFPDYPIRIEVGNRKGNTEVLLFTVQDSREAVTALKIRKALGPDEM